MRSEPIADEIPPGNSRGLIKSVGPIKSLTEFVSVTQDLIQESGLRQSTSGLWWRGQSVAKWPLTPSLYRSSVNSSYERELIRDFQLKSLPFLNSHRPTKGMEWLFLMQHHGAPTRILDWSESALIALYFCAEVFDREDDGAVWCLNPWTMNTATIDTQSVPPISSPLINNYLIDFNDPSMPRQPVAEAPVAVRIEYGFNRAHSQRGAATIHGVQKRPIEDLKPLMQRPKVSNTKRERYLTKIIIDGKSKMGILKSLNEFGIGAEILFPDLDGLSKALKLRYDHRYLGEKLEQR